MGSPQDEPERGYTETQHEVTLTQGFWIADTPVTQQLWEVVTGGDENRSRFKGQNRLVERGRWGDAQDFINKRGVVGGRGAVGHFGCQ